MKVAILFLVALAISMNEAKVFTRCGLAKELLKQGFPKSKLSHCMYLIYLTVYSE